MSREIISLLFLMSFIPFTSMLGFGAFTQRFVACNLLYWIALIYFSTRSSFKVKQFDLTVKKGRLLGKTQLIILSMIFGVAVLFISGRYAHFRLNFNLLDVFEFRAESKANTLPTLLLYLFSWSRTVNTILIAYFIRQKKLIWSVFCIFIQLLSFGYDGSKTTFFLVIFAIIINMFPSFTVEQLNRWVLRGVVIISFVCVMIFVLEKNIIPISILIRRVFYLPVRLSKDYFDFFTKNQPDYFRQSFLRYLGIKSPYDISIPYMIGGVYFNAARMSANNGLISDAVTNLGYPGIILMPLLISVILKLLDRSSFALDNRIYVTVALYISVVLTNSFLFTVLLTHGLLVTIVVLGLMKRQSDETVEENNTDAQS